MVVGSSFGLIGAWSGSARVKVMANFNAVKKVTIVLITGFFFSNFVCSLVFGSGAGGSVG